MGLVFALPVLSVYGPPQTTSPPTLGPEANPDQQERQTVAFPPNYRQERSNRDRAKNSKALEKQAKRDEKSMSRKQQQGESETSQPPAPQKDE